MDMKNQKGFVNIILIVVIVLVAGTVGYFVLIRKQEPVTPQTTAPPPAVQTPTSRMPIPAPTDETADWKTYKKQGLFEFKFPPKFSITEGSDTGYFSVNLKSPQNERISIAASWPVYPDLPKPVFKCPPDEIPNNERRRVVNVENTTFNGLRACKVISERNFIGIPAKKLDNPCPIVDFYVDGKDKKYFFLAGCSNDSPVETPIPTYNPKEFEGILATVKLLN